MVGGALQQVTLHGGWCYYSKRHFMVGGNITASDTTWWLVLLQQVPNTTWWVMLLQQVTLHGG